MRLTIDVLQSNGYCGLLCQMVVKREEGGMTGEPFEGETDRTPRQDFKSVYDGTNMLCILVL